MKPYRLLFLLLVSTVPALAVQPQPSLPDNPLTQAAPPDDATPAPLLPPPSPSPAAPPAVPPSAAPAPAQKPASVASPAPAPAKPPPPAPPPPQPPAPTATVAASGILGRNVDGPDGKAIGRVVDVLVDAGSNPRAVVIDVGGFLGVGARRIAVNWSDLTFPPTGSAADIKLDMTSEQISSAPAYTDQTKPADVVEPPPLKPPTASSPPSSSPAPPPLGQH